MVGFVNKAKQKGFAIFGITGRSDTQEDATVQNLSKVGYTPFDADNFYTKWSGTNPKPSDVTCADAAAARRSSTRPAPAKHIEKDLGYDIVLNVGDQWSDLQGGSRRQGPQAARTRRTSCRSPDLDGTPADPGVSPRSRFTMEPDGSQRPDRGRQGHPQHRHR